MGINAAHAGPLFPPKDVPSGSCPANTALVWSAEGDAGHLACALVSPMVSVPQCPAGQLLAGINNGVAVCLDPSPSCVTTKLGTGPWTPAVAGHNTTVNGQGVFAVPMATVSNGSISDNGGSGKDDSLEIYCVTSASGQTYGHIAMCLSNEECPWR